jgi:hypothetical protein
MLRNLSLTLFSLFLVIQSTSTYAAKRNYVFVHAGAMLGYIPARVLEEAAKLSETTFQEGVYKAMGISTGAIITGLLSSPVNTFLRLPNLTAFGKL